MYFETNTKIPFCPQENTKKLYMSEQYVFPLHITWLYEQVSYNGSDYYFTLLQGHCHFYHYHLCYELHTRRTYFGATQNEPTLVLHKKNLLWCYGYFGGHVLILLFLKVRDHRNIYKGQGHYLSLKSPS